MKKKEFREYDLSEKAFNVYSNSDFVFYENSGGLFFASDNGISEPFIVGNGTLKDVNDFLEMFG